MYKVQIGKTYFNLPETVKELSIGQFLDLRSAKPQDSVARMAVLFNVKKSELLNLQADEKVSKQFAKSVALTKSINDSIASYFASDFKFATPSVVKLLGTDVNVQTDLGKLPLGAFMQVKAIIYDVIADTGTGIAFDPTDRSVDVIAHYLYVPFMQALNKKEIPGMPSNINLSADKEVVEYSAEKADEFKEVVRDLPLTQAIPLANFFFLKHKRYYLNITGRLLTNLLQMRLRLKLKFSKHTATLTQSTD